MSRHDQATDEQELFALCRAELRQYPALQARYEWMLEGTEFVDKPRPVIPEGPGLDPRFRRSQGTNSSPTERIAVRLAEDPDFQMLKWLLSRYERCLTILSDQERKLVQARFFQNKSRDETMELLGVQWRRYRSIEAEALRKYALVAGLVPVDGRKMVSKW